jgi:porin
MRSTSFCLFLIFAIFPTGGFLAAAEPHGTGAGKNPPAEGAGEQSATMFPIPDYTGDLFSRSALTGDWGGARTAIAKKGLQFKVETTQFFQGVMSGGARQKGEYGGVNDYRILFDSAAAGLWPGGFIEIHGETYWGKSANGSTGAILPVSISDAIKGAGEGTYLSHLTVTQFLNERFALIAGKINTATGDVNAFAHGGGTGRDNFLGAAFTLNPVTYYASPYSTLGGGFIYLFGEKKQHFFNVMLYDTDAKITRSGFDTVFEGNTTYSATLRLETQFFQKTGHQSFGFLYGDGSFTNLSQDPRVLIADLLVGQNLPPSRQDGTWAFFYNFDQYLVTDPNDPSQGWGMFGRFGIADENTNLLHAFCSAGIAGTGIIPGRDRDRFGVGYYYQKLSEDRPLKQRIGDHEQGVEVFYQVAVTPWFDVTLDLQVVDGAIRNSGTAWVGGLRGQIAF